MIEMPHQLHVSENQDEKKRGEEIEEWIKKNNPTLNDFLVILDEFYGKEGDGEQDDGGDLPSDDAKSRNHRSR